MEKILKIKGKPYKQLYVSDNVPDMLRLFGIFMDWKEKPYVDADMRVRRADGKEIGVVVMRYRGKWRMLQEMFYETKNSNKKQTDMTKKESTKKTGKKTVNFAAKILKSQKCDYQKIFRQEVKKAGDPKQGAKNAGKIYRDRYGATATARWKKALKRAK